MVKPGDWIRCYFWKDHRFHNKWCEIIEVSSPNWILTTALVVDKRGHLHYVFPQNSDMTLWKWSFYEWGFKARLI